MSNREVLEWLGITVADVFVYLAAAAVAAMFFVSDATTDVVLAVFGVACSIVACPLGMKRNPEFSGFTNMMKLISYPLYVLFALGGVVVHFVWFDK